MTVSNKEKSYGLFILRTDGQHINVLESQNFDELHSEYESLVKKWEECSKKTKAFKLTKPIVTSFIPSLIYEITIQPVNLVMKNSNNPYESNMIQNGLSNTLNHGKFGNLLDDGYR